MKTYIIGLAVGLCAVTALASASPGTIAPENVLPVDLAYREAHGIRLPVEVEPVAPGKFILPVQDPDPNPVPSGWSAAYLFRLTGEKEDRASAGALKNLGTLTRGKLRLSLDGYAGVTLKLAVPVVATLLGVYAKPFDQDLTVGLHLGAIVSGAHPTGLAFGVSGNWKF